MQVDDMTLTLAIDQTDVKATIPAFMTQPDEAILPYTIGFVPWEWIEKSTYFKKISKGLTSAIPNNYFFYNPSDVISEQTKGVPFVYTIRTGNENQTCGVYDNNGTYTPLPYASNNANLRILHSFNTEAIINGAANAGMQVNDIRLYYYGFEVLANEQGWLGNQVNNSVSPIAGGSVYAQITPMPDIKLAFSASISSVTGGTGYTITEEIFDRMNDNGIVAIDGGTYESGGVSLKRTLYLFITSALLETGNAAYPGFGTMILNNARCCGVVNTGGGATPTYFHVTYGQSRENQFIAGEVAISTKQYPSAYGYYVDVPENGQCVFRWAVSAWINTFVSGGCTWNDILIMLLTAFPAYKINDVYYCAEFDDDYQLTGRFIEFEYAKEWQKNINPENNIFDYKDIPEPAPPSDERENIGDKITRPASIGVGGTNGFVTQYALNRSDVAQLGALLWTSFVDQDYWKNFLFSLALDTGTLQLSGLLNFFVSMKVYPFSLRNIAGYQGFGQDMYVGTGIIPLHFSTNIGVLSNYCDYISGGHIDIPRYFNDYRDYINTEISLYLPFCGTVQLNPGDVIGNRIDIQYAIDFATGGCIAYVDLTTGDGAGYPVGALPGQIGADIPLTATAAGEVAARFIGDGLNVAGMIGGEVSRTASGVAGALGGNPSGGSGGGSIFAGVAGMYGGAGAAMAADLAPGLARQGLQMLQRGAVQAPMLSGGRGFASFGAPARPFVQIRRGIYPEVSGLADIVGKPAAGTYTIGSLSGYVQGDAKVDGLSCPDSDKAKIKNLIAGGIYV